MSKFTQDELINMSRAIAGDQIGDALAIYGTRYPDTGDKVFQSPDRDLIEGMLMTRPRNLRWLHPAELRELQTVAAMNLITGKQPKNLLRAGQQWNYSMPLQAAVNSVISNYNWSRDRAQFRKWGLLRVWRYIRTCDPGTCLECEVAGRYLYSDEDFPGSPLPECSNNECGCRCLAMSFEAKEAEELLSTGNLSWYSTVSDKQNKPSAQNEGL